MPLITANGKAAIGATIMMGRVGAATADLTIDAQEAPVGACTLAIESGLTLVGHATRAGVWQDTVYLRWTAGNGDLRKAPAPKHYRSTTLRVVLLDLLRAAGETLSLTADTKTLSLQFPAWTVISRSGSEPATVGNAISALLMDSRLAAHAWRILPDGTLWVGPETWPDAGLKDITDFQELGRLPHEGRSELGFEAPSLLPGTMLVGRKVSYVEHVMKDDCVRTMAWFED